MEVSQAGMWFAIGAAVILLLVDLWAINSVFRSDKSSGTKTMWAIVILLLPVVGLAIWGLEGPRGVVTGPTSPEHSKG